MTIEEMRTEAIRNIEHLIWAAENMDTKSSRYTVTNNLGRAQGAIQLAHDLKLITEDEYGKYWDAANEAAMNNPAFWNEK